MSPQDRNTVLVIVAFVVAGMFAACGLLGVLS
jgi:hypothetical protein